MKEDKISYHRIKVGHVVCDSGVLVITDPATINEHWKKIHPADLDKDKRYMILKDLSTIEYGKDFINEEEIIDKLGKSVKQAKIDGDINECLPEEDRSFNLRGAVNISNRIDMKDQNWMLNHPKSSLPGAGIVVNPSGGEGLYPVYAIMKYDSELDKYTCVELKIEFI